MYKEPLREDQQLISFDKATPQAWARLQAAQPFMPPTGGAGSSSLAAYWQVLMHRRWTVLAVMVIVTVLSSFSSLKTKPVYKSVSRVEVEAEAPQVQMLNDVYQQAHTDQDTLRTQIQILQADNLAWRTIEQLGLGQNPAFAGTASNQSTDSDARKQQLVATFKSQLSADLMPGTRIILVGFESTDPHLAARVVNALVENYTEYSFRQKYDGTRQAAGRMEQQLDELKAKVEASQRELVGYQRKHSIVDSGDKANVIEQQLSQLSNDLTQAQSDRIGKEVLYNQVKSNPDRVQAATQSDLLHRLQEKQADLHAQYVQALDTYGPNYPKVLRLKREGEEAESQITGERLRSVDRYYGEYVAAKGREQLLLQAVVQQKQELGNFSQLLVEHNILKGEFETNQQLYQRLLQHLKDATVTAGLRSTNIHVVDPALPPTGSIRPRTKFNMAAGLFLGLLLGAVLAFIQEAADSSLRTPEDVELLMEAPALASIPSAVQTKAERLLSANGAKGNQSASIAMLQNSISPLSEAYRALRTSVLLSTASRAPQTILITSSTGGEGKTTTAVNLALALAQGGSSVLLLDCDLRRPCVANILDISNLRGMSTFLTGNDKIDDVMQQYIHAPNLSVVPSGPVPPNPADLVSSDLMATLLRELSSRFKHVIVDSPPLLAVTDATILSTLVEGSILVVESGVTPKKMILRARRTLNNANARLLGVVLNKVRAHHDSYYDVYYRGYYHETKEAA